MPEGKRARRRGRPKIRLPRAQRTAMARAETRPRSRAPRHRLAPAPTSAPVVVMTQASPRRVLERQRVPEARRRAHPARRAASSPLTWANPAATIVRAPDSASGLNAAASPSVSTPVWSPAHLSKSAPSMAWAASMATVCFPAPTTMRTVPPGLAQHVSTAGSSAKSTERTCSADGFGARRALARDMTRSC